MSELFLFQSLDNIRELGFASDIPDYIEKAYQIMFSYGSTKLTLFKIQ